MRFPACETFGLYYCEALVRSGDLAKAKVQLAECLQVIQPSEAAFYVACAERLLGEVALAEAGEQLPIAASYFESCMAAFERLGADNELALAWTGFGRLKQKMGERTSAHEYLTKALQTFERLGTRIEPDRVRRTLAELG
jgi:tetratricopeptide (TPR) repeat protein